MVTAVLNNVSVFRLATFKRTHKILVGRQSMREGGREAEEEEEGEEVEEDAEKLVPLHFVVPEESGVSASKTCMAYYTRACKSEL